jgi:hypothetical protein
VAGLFFIAIGNVLPKTGMGVTGNNWPKSLGASEHRRVQKITGGFMMASGLGLLAASALNLPPPWLFACTVLGAFFPAFAGIV